MKRALLYIILLFVVLAQAQKGDSIRGVYANQIFKLKSIASDAFYSKKEADRMAANKEFIKAIDEIAKHQSAMEFPFDSIKDISTLSPKDKKFKLITWNVHKEDQTHLFFGFLLVNNTKRIKKGFFKYETINSYEYFKLIDVSGTVNNPETFIGTPAKWFGMLYYELIECEDHYTLLGWDGNTKLIQRKFIDALYFKSDGTPVFGKDMFRVPRKSPRRLMFEYSGDVTMSLKYNSKEGRIIYSHLGPREEGEIMQGLPQYYGPDGSFDSMILKKGRWTVVEDIDARNEKNKNDKADKPDPRKQKPVFVPK